MLLMETYYHLLVVFLTPLNKGHIKIFRILIPLLDKKKRPQKGEDKLMPIIVATRFGRQSFRKESGLAPILPICNAVRGLYV